MRRPPLPPTLPRPRARVKEERVDGLGGDRSGSSAGCRRAVAPPIARPPRSPPSWMRSVVLSGRSRPREIIVIDDTDDDDDEGDVPGGSGDKLQETLLVAGSLEGGRRGMGERLGDPGRKLVDVGARARARATVATSKPGRRPRSEATGRASSRSAGGRAARPGRSSEKEDEEEQVVAKHSDEHQQEVVEEEEEAEGEEEKEEEDVEEAVEMKVDESSSDDNGRGQASEQDGDAMMEDNNADESGESQGNCTKGGGGTEDDVEVEEEEEDSHPNSDDTLDEEQSEEGESEDDDLESNEEEEEQNATSGDVMAGRNSRSGGEGTHIFRKKLFEGLCLTKQVDNNTVGSGIKGRTRSNFKERKCLDKKLLTRGTYRKPYCIDVLESSSEEDIPAAAAAAQDLPSSSNEGYVDDDSEDGRMTSRRRLRRERYACSDVSVEEKTFARNFRKGSSSKRARKRALDQQQTVKESGNDYNGGNSQYAKNSGRNAGGLADRGHALGDISFKKNALIAQRKKRGRTAADRRMYNDLINSMFNELENFRHGPVCAQVQSENRLPLVFSFGDEVEMEDKSEHDKFQDDLWREFDFALETSNICSHSCKEGDLSNGQEIPVDKATSCSKGKHDFFVDEQIGVRCKHCDFIDLEIRHVLPSMDKFSMERETLLNPKLGLVTDDMLTSMGYEGGHNFGGHRTGMVSDLVSGVWEDMFPHQKEAFEFMWEKLAGGVSIEHLKHKVNTDVEGGCVISHAPGTGKTRLAITFVQSYLELFPQCGPVIIAPRGMLATWELEFRKWNVKLPFHVLNSSEIHWKGDKTIQEMVAKDEKLAQKLFKNKLNQKSRRLVKLNSWYEGSSMIGVSYSLFRKLAKDEGMDGHKVREVLLQRPDLLVLDEGHTPRNKRSLIWKVLAEVRTEKRIILSGTPFQNNFLELYNILHLVRPRFVREFACKRTNQLRPAPHSDIQQDLFPEKDEGKDFWASLKLNNITDEYIDEIKKILDPFVHIHNGDILHKNLPGLKESVVILDPLPRQKDIITKIERIVAKGILDAEYKISLASVHPWLITCTKLSKQEASVVDKSSLQTLRMDPLEGVKTRFVLEIVRLCVAFKERVLVFSQYLEPLSLIMEQLTRKFKWTEGTEILLMSGSVLSKNRQAMMEAFNDMKSEAKVMLASTKACCEGITLVGASRVVLLDVVWNPSVGRQAIGRAYRIGQKRTVYTYSLIAGGTKEKHKFDRQAKKEDMSKRLFSNGPRPSGCNLSSKLSSNDKILDELTDKLKDIIVQILPSH